MMKFIAILGCKLVLFLAGIPIKNSSKEALKARRKPKKERLKLIASI